ncbi:MAG: type II secretion system protein GspD, partial [Candidatus Hydrogenedentota bacterium]
GGQQMGGFGGQTGGYGGQMGGYGGQTGGFGGTTGGYGGQQIGGYGGTTGGFGGTTGGFGGTTGGFGGTTGGFGAGGIGGQPMSQVGIIALLQNIIDDVVDPYSGRVLSFMDYNPMTNQLIVHNTPSNLRELEAQIPDLDVTPKQVSIESKFLTVEVDDIDKVGMTWDANLSDLGNRAREIPALEDETYSYDVRGDGDPVDIPFYSRPDGSEVIRNTVTEGILESVMSPGPEGAFSLSGVISSGSDGDELGVVMDYLNSLSETEVLSAPRVTTMNRKPAVIADFQTRVFNTGVFSEVFVTDPAVGIGTVGQPTVGSTEELQFTQFLFGITFSVTPQISDDQVRLWLNPQVTTQIGEDEFTQRTTIGDVEQESTMRFPRQSTQSVWTNVIVRDGDTLVLGGLVQDRSERSEERMPYLADIPLLGNLFRGHADSASQSSLLIFVTTDILDPSGARFFEAGG